MVQAMINLTEHEDRILNIVKGKFGLKNKSEAIAFVLEKYEGEMLEPGLRPEYKEELLKIDRGKFKRYTSVEQLRKDLENA